MMNKYSVGSKNGHRGFTLIELMIVLVVAAILALIAYKVYTSYVGGAQRSDTQAALMETAQPMAHSYVAPNKYPTESTVFSDLRTTLPSKVAGRSA